MFFPWRCRQCHKIVSKLGERYITIVLHTIIIVLSSPVNSEGGKKPNKQRVDSG